MFALTLLNKNNEIMPMKAAGLSLYRIVTPIFIAGGVFSLATFLSQEFLIPNMRDSIREVFGYAHTTRSIRSQVVRDAEGKVFTVGRYWPAQKRGEDVIVAEYRFKPELGKEVLVDRYMAPYLHWEPVPEGTKTKLRGQWVLKQGGTEPVRRDVFDENGLRVKPAEGNVPYQKYVRKVIATDLTPEDFESAGENVQYLSLADLQRRWNRQQVHNNLLLVKIHQHWSFPLTHVVLLLIGLPFVLNQNNRSVFLGVLVSVGICVAYFIVHAMCTELGSKGAIQPVVAAWLPVVFFTGLGVVLFDNLRT
jgi:lipopolysaccharide export system permease protein